MKKIITYFTKLAGLTLLLVGFSVQVFAQDAPESLPDKPRRHVDPERVKQLLAKVEEVKHQKIREVLNLDDEGAKKFFAQYEPAEKELITLVKQRQVEELKLLQLTRGDYKDADVDPTMQSIKNLNQQIQDRYETLDNSLKSVLTPRQRAKLAVFEKEFNRRVREKIREKREQWRDDHPRQRRLRGIDGDNSPTRRGIK
ncbi:MAG: hypothetical protein ABI778_06500 [Ignavibacteriota bacterium]